MWGEVSCLRRQHDGSWDWASNHCPLDLKSNALTTTPLRPLVLAIALPFCGQFHLRIPQRW